jgi:cytochrome oxidase assembly protein ShyY1
LANRKSNSPWGSSYKEGLPSTAVNDTVEIDQNVRATINTGVIDVATGQWQGIRLSDEQFLIDATHEAIANGGVALSPQAQPDFIDMTGYKNLMIAVKPSNAGNYKLQAVMGPVTNMFANLTPINAAAVLRGWVREGAGEMDELATDGAEALVADVWNIYCVCIPTLANQKVLQWKITNNSGGPSNIDFAYMRIV